jgi:hypothetical protein
MADWLDQLYQLRKVDAAKQEEGSSKPAQQPAPRQYRASDILRRCEAHKLLRRVQEALLEGGGTLDVFERAGSYERAIALVWQGPISAARRPNPEDPEDYQYIVVGAQKGKLYVNGKRVSSITPEALKTALLEASKKPKRKSQKG